MAGTERKSGKATDFIPQLVVGVIVSVVGVVLGLVLTPLGNELTADRHNLTISLERSDRPREIGLGMDTHLAYEHTITFRNDGDFVEEAVTTSFGLEGIAYEEHVAIMASSSPSMLTLGSWRCEPNSTNRYSTRQQFSCTIDRLNPGEWVTERLFAEKPGTLFAEARSTTSSNEARLAVTE
jgi:hypothetical protein